MANDQIDVEYNLNLKSLEDMLEQVSRPGDFFMNSSKELPMPKITINGVGALSFPLPASQVHAMIHQASLAPYGRGEKTILDTAVRKTWQIPPDQVSIEGKSWDKHFSSILEDVKQALGCLEIDVTAELYKLLIYDEGSFFLPHRDSEKAHGMFGTMVISLPSPHSGGELIIRHKGREAKIAMNHEEASELKIAAFYADCEHEVLPITKGYRVCLVYNLIQKTAKGNKSKNTLNAPYYAEEANSISQMLKDTFADEDAPAKLVWLLEHQYSQAELSFNTLKNADMAIAKVLMEASALAECDIHLGIVHIEESGPAEADFGYYSRGRGYESEKEASSEDYEVIDISESDQYVDTWVNVQNQKVKMGSIPIDENELLPQDALSDIEPDVQRLLEATGNAGVSFERAYHRAAIIIWPKEDFIKILLQSGINSALNFLKEQMANKASLSEIRNNATWVIEAWGRESGPTFGIRKGDAIRAEMLSLLCLLKDSTLVNRFINLVIDQSYDGSENTAIFESLNFIELSSIPDIFSNIIKKHIKDIPYSCIALFKGIVDRVKLEANGIIKLSEAFIEGLKNIDSAQENSTRRWWVNKEQFESNSIADLWLLLNKFDKESLSSLVQILVDNPGKFDPRSILAPAMVQIHKSDNSHFSKNSACLSVWMHTSQFLLNKSEFPPEEPKDWSQDDKISCSCENCKQLKKFMKDTVEKEYRFKVLQAERNHISQMISSHGLDMKTTEDTSKRPYTLVCTKTRSRHLKKCEEHKADVKAMKMLIPLVNDATGVHKDCFNLQDRLNKAVAILCK